MSMMCIARNGLIDMVPMDERVVVELQQEVDLLRNKLDKTILQFRSVVARLNQRISAMELLDSNVGKETNDDQ